MTGKPGGRRPPLAPLLLACASAILLAGPLAAAPPRIVSQTKLGELPGTIVSWQDSTCLVLGHDSTGVSALIEYHPDTKAQLAVPLGVHGRGAFLSVAPDRRSVMVRETDSTGVHRLQYTRLPSKQWRDLIPVTDADPHVTWYLDSQTFLYQDILDDARSTPSVFRFHVGTPLPKLFMVASHRPLVAPSGDAIVCVGVDTLNPGPTANLESRQPVGMEDLKAGDFHWVAPMRTWIPTRGAWSPDGNRVALIGYSIDSTAVQKRQVYIHSRITRANTVVRLAGDDRRPDRDHSTDVALWSPDGEWIAVPMVTPRSGEPDFKGGIWLMTKTGQQPTLLVPTEGAWRGTPIWIGNRKLLVPDIESPATLARSYWIVEVSG